MTETLAQHTDSAQLVLGLAYLFLALSCGSQRRFSQLSLPWGWLAIFALARGLHQWERMVSNGIGGGSAWLLHGALGVATVAAATEAARVAGRAASRWRWGPWPHAAWAVVLATVVSLSSAGLVAGGAADQMLLAAWAPCLIALWPAARIALRKSAGPQDAGLRPVFNGLMGAACAALLRAWLVPISAGSHPARAAAMALMMIEAALVLLSCGTLRRHTLGALDRSRRKLGRVDWAALALLTVVVAGWLATDRLGDAAKAMLRQDGAAATNLLAEALEGGCAEAERAVASLAAAPTIVQAMSRRDPADLARADELLDRYAQSWGFAVCYLLDTDGRGLRSSNRGTPQSFVGVDYAFRPFWRQSMEGRPARYMAMGLKTGERGFFASTPVRDADGAIRAVAVVKRNIDGLAGRFAAAGRTFLVSPEGVIFLAGRREDVLRSLWPIGERRADSQAMQRQFGATTFAPILAAPVSMGQFVEVDGVPHAVARHMINGGWSVVTLVPAQRVTHFRLLALSVAGLLGFLALGLTWVTEQGRLSDAMVSASDRRFREILETSHLAAVTIDLEGRITFCNDFLLRVADWRREDVLGRDWHALFAVGGGDQRKEFLSKLAAGDCPSQAEFRIRTRGGDPRVFRWHRTMLRDIRGQVIGLSALGEDVTESKAMEEQLRTAARTDRLTGLPNRAFLLDRLQQAILRHQRSDDDRYAVLFLDFDRFKLINDSLGHEAGDLLLREIASRLRKTVRAVDSVFHDQDRDDDATAARLGGDEFVILLDGLKDEEHASIVAERILDALARPYHLGDREVFSTTSIGIVTSRMSAATAEDVLRDADTAMYEAKSAGRGRFVVFDQTMRQRVQQRLSLETDLRRATELGQLFLLYQPIVSLETGQVESFEALVRWKHPQRGIVSPAEFIPVAEESGLILPIGQWVLEQACLQMAAWQSAGAAPPSVSVNLSRAQLSLPELPALVARAISSAGIDPARVHLEITESAVMRNQEAAIATLRQLRQLGVKLDLDDFGTGYSSLASLHQFPLDVLKIDRSFVANISRGRDFAALVQAVTQLARNLGIAVVAEGIETLEQMQMLQALECRFGQGYLFSKPLPPEQAIAFRPSLSMLAA